ncbi:winged helix-turn-helix transcriptional regulator [Dactylosporangium sp. CS-033363]|uniref:winged helix-turn-helix transcriptional regulator n=1 Tax=Dactylosporangium sp. CS-033363 TaxID=3239935 RepID=UPI003D8A1EEC
MVDRTAGHFNGITRALDLVGERWTLRIIRDLLVSPRRYTDLRNGEPPIPTNTLAARLRELEAEGIVGRRVLPRPANAVVYELTDRGKGLEGIIIALGRWGARALTSGGEPDPLTTDTLVIAMRTMFDPFARQELDAVFELHVGEVAATLCVRHGVLETAPGVTGGADLVIHTGQELAAILTGELDPQEALRSGVLRLDGDHSLLAPFLAAFHFESSAT